MIWNNWSRLLFFGVFGFFGSLSFLFFFFLFSLFFLLLFFFLFSSFLLFSSLVFSLFYCGDLKGKIIPFPLFDTLSNFPKCQAEAQEAQGAGRRSRSARTRKARRFKGGKSAAARVGEGGGYRRRVIREISCSSKK